MDYIQINVAFTAIIPIPSSASSDTVNYVVYNSDGTTFASGSMTFVADEMWKCVFTPTALGSYILKVNDTTISSKRENIYSCVGASPYNPIPSTGDLTNLTSLREYLGKKTADTADDAFLGNIISRISAIVKRKLDNNIVSQDYTEYYKGDGTNKLLVKHFPITAIASIYDDVGQVWDATTLKPPSEYIISNQILGLVQLLGDIFINSQWWTYYNIENIKITYTAGYATVPADVEDAVNKLCAIEYQQSKGIIKTVKTDRDPSSLKDEAWDQLLPYRKFM